MPQQNLKDIFKSYAQKNVGIFRDSDVLSPNYIPDVTLHRDREIKQLADIIAPSLGGARISNLFIYGVSGTGKTLVTQAVTSQLEKESSNRVGVFYINCKMERVSDTEYRLLAELSRMLGRPVPATGLPTQEVYKKFYSSLESIQKYVILVLDEIDALVKKIGDGVLYNLLRINQRLPNIKLSIIGISNDIRFLDTIDPRVRSSLSEEELIFHPYNANQLKDILNQRASLAFNNGSLGSGVIEKAAALAAQEHGDARRALDLLRIAGELAEREGKRKVTVDYIDIADSRLDMDKYIEFVTTQPIQPKAVLAAIIKLVEKGNKDIKTGDVYSFYEKICQKSGLKVLTQRRVSDLITQFDTNGIINTRTVSWGRYGKSREIRILLAKPILKKTKEILKDLL